MGEPWVKIKVGLVKSDKVGDLPSDQARWGWVKALAEGKLQRRMGVFASRAHLAELLGHHGRYIADYVRVGLAHDVPEADEAWPENCTDRRCDRYYRSVARPGEVVIHDFRLEQRDPTNADRQEAFRNAGGNGTRNAPSNASVTALSRALSPSQSLTPSTSSTRDEPYQVADEPDERIRTWLAGAHHIAIREGNGYHERIIGWLRQGSSEDDIRRAIDRAVADGAKGDRAVMFRADEILFPPLVQQRITPEQREAAEREAVVARYGRRTDR